MSKQNIQDRYFGRNDPVANKILREHTSFAGLAPPADASIVRSSPSLLSLEGYTLTDLPWIDRRP